VSASPAPLTQAQLFEIIAKEQSPERRARLVRAWKIAYGGRTSEDSGAKRDIDHRRSFFGDPWKYAADVFGYTLYPDLERLIDACMRNTRVLAPAANDLGKTFGITLWATYRYDVVAAMPDDDAGLEQQGCLILLPGPTEDGVFATTYLALVKHFERAVRRGFGMPGWWSHKSINMRAGPDWYVEAICPQIVAGEEVAHAASGRHHRQNLIVVIEEGQAVREAVWLAMDGSASGTNDTIVSPFNPDIPVGPARDRAESGEWEVIHMSALDHPNVRQRRIVIPGAVSHKSIDRAVRDQCKDMGRASARACDPKFNDFLYAVPPRGSNLVDPRPRTDGHPGHADAELHVYRPNAMFTAQRLGRWPLGESALLFTPEHLQESALRWAAGEDPDRPPDAVGLDPARYGDDAVTTPRWGPPAGELLKRYHEAARAGTAAADRFRADPKNRIRCGEPRVMPKGDGHALADAACMEFPRSPFVVDQGGGDSVIDQMRNALSRDVLAIPFGGTPWDPVEGERPAVDMRAAMYIRAAELYTYGLIDSPMPTKLKKDLLAHYVVKLVYRAKDVEVDGGWQKTKTPAARVIDKPEIKKKTGRSPDYGDSHVLSLVEPHATGAHSQAALIRIRRP
jgi:hypothetical protein